MTFIIDNVPGFLLFLILIALLLLVVLRIVQSVRPLFHPKKHAVSVPKPRDRAFDASPPPTVTTFPASARAEELEFDSVFVHIPPQPPLTREQYQAWDRLPPRQKEAAILVASGISNRQVAARMHIQLSTVQGYLKETYAALNVRSRTELANLVHDISLENSP